MNDTDPDTRPETDLRALSNDALERRRREYEVDALRATVEAYYSAEAVKRRAAELRLVSAQALWYPILTGGTIVGASIAGTALAMRLIGAA